MEELLKRGVNLSLTYLDPCLDDRPYLIAIDYCGVHHGVQAVSLADGLSQIEQWIATQDRPPP